MLWPSFLVAFVCQFNSNRFRLAKICASEFCCMKLLLFLQLNGNWSF